MKTLMTRVLRILARWKPQIMFDLIRSQLGDKAPFIRHVGIDIKSVGKGIAETEIPDAPHLKNHIGTAHAAAVFMLCETASGAAMAGAFIPVLLEIRPVVREARINYLRTGRGALHAVAKIATDPELLLQRLTSDGSVDFDIEVEAQSDDGIIVATATYVWNLKKGERQ